MEKFIEAADRLSRVIVLWFQPIGALHERWGQLQTVATMVTVLVGGAVVEAITNRVAGSAPGGVGFAVAAPSLIAFLGLFASWRQQQLLDQKPDEIDSAITSLRASAFEVNAYNWDQATVFGWAGEELLLKHLSEFELAYAVAQKMRMRSIDSIRIERALKQWDLMGLISWELLTPVPPDTLGRYLPGATPYNSYKLTDLGKRVLARLRDIESTSPALKKSAEPIL